MSFLPSFSWHAVYALAIGVFSIAWINLGVAFINGILLPSMFGWAYANWTPLVRMLVILLPVFGLANYLINFSFKFSAAVAAPTLAACSAGFIVLVGLGALQKWPNLEISLGLIALVVVSVWLSLALGRLS